MDDRAETKFTVQFAVDKKSAEDSNYDIVPLEKQRYAAQLGEAIAEKKGWEKVDPPFSGDAHEYRLSVYVFTPSELRSYLRSLGYTHVI